MSDRPLGARLVLCVALGLGLVLGGCGGGSGGGDSGGGSGGGSSALALGQTAVVQHTEIGSSTTASPTTTIAITVLAVRKGTQDDLTAGGFDLDADQKTATPYYVDVRYKNTGTEAIARTLDVGLENGDGDLISSTTILSLGGAPFGKCVAVDEGELAPGASYESCSLFLVPQGSEPAKVSFLPYDPSKETDFVYWKVT